MPRANCLAGQFRWIIKLEERYVVEEIQSREEGIDIYCNRIETWHASQNQVDKLTIRQHGFGL